MKVQSSPSLRLPVSLAFFGFALVGMNSGANGVLLPSLSAFYHVGDAVIGLLFLVSSSGYFLSALSSGPLIERLALRWVLLLGATTFLLGLLGFGLELPFVWLLPARLLLGFGVGIIETGLNIYVAAIPRNTVLLNYTTRPRKPLGLSQGMNGSSFSWRGLGTGGPLWVTAVSLAGIP